jgi:hypothetical protein
LIAGTLGLALLGVAAPAPAQASLYAPTALVLGLSHGENPQTVQRAATLRCDPAGGDHPSSEEACAALDDVDGNFSMLSGEDGVCTKEYRPVTVTVTGVWRGRFTEYRRVFPNRCMLIQAKGPVFDF